MRLAIGLWLKNYKSSAGGGDVIAPTVTIMSYTAPTLTATISEVSTAYFLANLSATPLSGASIVSQVLAGTPAAYGSFSAAVGVNNHNASAALGGLAAGTWYIHVAAQDAALNTTALGAVDDHIIADVVAPTISAMSYTAPTLSLTLSEGATVFFLAQASATPIAGSSVVSQVIATTPAAYGSYIRGAGASTYNASADLAGLAVGTWYIHAAARDAALNVTATSVVATYVVADTTAPTVTVMSYASPTLTATFSEACTAYFLVSASATPIAGSSIVSQVLAGTPTKYGSFSASSGVNNQNISAAMAGLADGTWYMHVAGRDAALNVTATGAVDEFIATTPDVVAPSITSLAITTGNVTATVDENCTIYYMFNTNATPLAGSVIKAASSGVFGSFAYTSPTTTYSADVSGLAPATAYQLHCVGEDASANLGAFGDVVAYTTPSTGLYNVSFNGTTSQLTRGAGLTGEADSTSLSFCAVFTTAAATEQCLLATQNTTFLLDIDTNGDVYMSMKNTAGTTVFSGYLGATSLLDGTEHTILGAFNGTAGTFKVYIDGVDKSGSNSLTSGTTFDLTDTDWHVGRFSNGSLRFGGSLKQLVLWQGANLDVTNATVRTNMIDPAQGATLGTNIIDLRFATLAEWQAGTNNGSGGTFAAVALT